MSTGKKVFVPNFSLFKSGVSLPSEPSVLPAASEPGLSIWLYAPSSKINDPNRGFRHLITSAARQTPDKKGE